MQKEDIFQEIDALLANRQVQESSAKLRGFLSEVLPPLRDGELYARFSTTDEIAQPGENYPQNKGFASLDALTAGIREADLQGKGVWFGLASFGPLVPDEKHLGKMKLRRTHDNARRIQVFAADVDCGAGKPYATLTDALPFAFELEYLMGLPASLWVCSGYGLHLYWVLEAPLEIAEWHPVAARFKRALVASDVVQIDPKITDDAARVLRPVGTTNKKRGDVAPVYVLRNNGVRYALWEVGEAIARLENIPGVELPFELPAGRPVRRVLNSDLDYTPDFPKVSAHAVAEHCAQIRWHKETGSAGNYDHWLASIGTIKHSLEGEELAHEWSSVAPGYDYDATQDKLDDVFKTGPARCTTFAACNPAGCQGCRFAGKVTSPLQVAWAGAVARVEGAAPAGGYIRADTGNAARFVDTNLHRLRAMNGQVCWAWDGKRYRQEPAIAMQCAIAMAREMLDEAVKIDDENARKAAVQHAMATNSAGKLEALLKLAASDPRILVNADQFDADQFGLNTPEGYVDLKTGEMLPHDAARLCTKLTRVSPDWTMPTPVFDRFLCDIFAGNPAMIEHWLRVGGYLCTGSTREQVLFFLYGGGSNGKGTFVELLAFIFGDYAAPIDTSLLTDGQKGGGPDPNLVALRALRMAFFTETSDGAGLAEARVKWLTGSDMLTGHDKYEKKINFSPTHKIVLSGNFKPIIRGTDNGIWRRILLELFGVQFSDDTKDPFLPEKLRAEAPGILAKLIDGCLRWQQDGLKTPAAVKGATAAYREESDTIGEFLVECCETGEGMVVPHGQLYPAYRDWAARNGIVPLGGKRFGSLLEERGFPHGKGTGGVRIRRGLRLRPSALRH